MMPKRCFGLVGVAVLVAFLGCLPSVCARTWTDTKGRKQKGTYDGREDGYVYIVRDKDERRIRIKLSKLSKADQEFVAAQPESPGKEDKPNAQPEVDEEAYWYVKWWVRSTRPQRVLVYIVAFIMLTIFQGFFIHWGIMKLQTVQPDIYKCLLASLINWVVTGIILVVILGFLGSPSKGDDILKMLSILLIARIVCFPIVIWLVFREKTETTIKIWIAADSIPFSAFLVACYFMLGVMVG